MKRILCLLLCAAMALSLLTACGPKAPDEPSEQKDPAASDPSVPADPSAPEPEEETIDLKGYEFLISDDVSGAATYVFMPEMGDSIISDNWLEHKKAVEKELNCKVTAFQGNADLCVSRAAVGEHYTDFMNNRLKGIFTLWRNDLCFNARDLDLDFESGKYGSEALLDSLTWKGVTVAVYGDYWGIPSPNMCNTMMYNPRLIREFNLQDPQELYERKMWNWNTFENMAKLIAEDNSEEPANKKYIATLTTYIISMAIYSYGASYYTVDESGRYSSALESNDTIYALDWVQDLYKKGYFHKNVDLGTVTERFSTGLDFFLPEYSMQGLAKEGGDVGLEMEEEYRWIYYPLGRAEADVTRGQVSGENFFLSVLYDIDEAKLTPFMDRFFDKTFENEYDWQDSFAAMNLYDDFSREYYFNMWNSATYNYSDFFGYDSVSSVLLKMIPGEKTPAESVADAAARSTRLLNKYINPPEENTAD